MCAVNSGYPNISAIRMGPGTEVSSTGSQTNVFLVRLLQTCTYIYSLKCAPDLKH